MLRVALPDALSLLFVFYHFSSSYYYHWFFIMFILLPIMLAIWPFGSLCCKVELPSLEEDEEEDEGAQFNLELDMNERRGPLVSSASDGLGSQLSSAELMKNEQAEKLDIMMTVCLHHFHDLCHDKDGNNIAYYLVCLFVSLFFVIVVVVVVVCCFFVFSF